MLAIVRGSFDLPSETFVRSHVRVIAPRSTVLICASSNGTESLRCPVLTVPFKLKDASNRARALRFLQHHKVDVMLAEFADTAWCFLPVCREAKIKLYVHFHGFDASANLLSPAWLSRYQILFTHSSGHIAPCRFLAKKLADAGCPLRRLHVSPTGVDPKRFKPAIGDPMRVLAVGRLVEKKAPHLTIRAFAGVLERFPQARLDMIGDGALREKCMALIQEQGLTEVVRLLGPKSSDQVADAMRRASVFVQHSVTSANGNTEGLPVAILEAMASELPVVATRHSGIPEAVVDGETGILVDEHDVAGTTQAILGLLANRDQAEIMGKAGRQRVLAHFTESQMRHRLRAIMGLSLRWRLRNAFRA